MNDNNIYEHLNRGRSGAVTDPVTHYSAKQAIKRCGLRSGDTILDYGCSVGRAAKVFKEYGCTVYGGYAVIAEK